MTLDANVKVRIDRDTQARLEALGRAQDRPVGSIVRLAIRDYLRAHEAAQEAAKAAA